MSTPIIGFAAFSGTGKTTLIEQVIPLLIEREIKVGLIKASHHDVDPDKPGKDSYRLRKAGASQLVLSTPNRSICYTEQYYSAEPTLDEQVRLLDLERLDLVIVEGFREAKIPKIECHRLAHDRPFLFEYDPHIIALAWDGNLGITTPRHLPLLSINDPDQVARFLLDYCCLGDYDND